MLLQILVTLFAKYSLPKVHSQESRGGRGRPKYDRFKRCSYDDAGAFYRSSDRAPAADLSSVQG